MSTLTMFGSLCLLILPGGMLVQETKSPSGQQPLTNSAQGARQNYQRLVERVKGGDRNVDFVQLVSAASDWDLAEPGRVEAPNREEMVAAFDKKDYQKAAQLADAVLEFEFTNRGLHRATENAYRKLGNTVLADFHRDVADRILGALLSTGDGKSTQTAYCVQSISEEYLIMQHFGYKVSVQAYLLTDGSSYDFLQGMDTKTKKSAGLYFDISGHFSRCVRKHAEGSISQ
jgi:hypothetical protein